MAEQSGSQGGSVIRSGNVAGLLAFLDFLVDKGYAPRGSMPPIKAACRTVFSRMQGEETYEALDVRGLELDDYLDRFETLVTGDYKTESIASYRARVKRGLNAYLSFLDTGNVSAFRASTRASRPKTPKVTAPTVQNGNGNGNGNGHAEHSEAASLIDYPFPLRNGQIAHLRLPTKLDKIDADRVGAFVQTLVFDPQLAIPAETGAAA
jgi:hypothetical protein